MISLNTSLAQVKRDTTKVHSKIELIGQVFKFIEEFCYFGCITGGCRAAIDGFLTKARNRWSKPKNLINFLTMRILYFVYHCITL